MEHFETHYIILIHRIKYKIYANIFISISLLDCSSADKTEVSGVMWVAWDLAAIIYPGITMPNLTCPPTHNLQSDSTF